MAVTAGFMVPHPPLIVPAIGKGEEQAITDAGGGIPEGGGGKLQPSVRKRCGAVAAYGDVCGLFSCGLWTLGVGRFRTVPGGGQVKLEAEYDTEFVRQLLQPCRQGKVSRWERWENGTDSWITASWCRCIL